MSDEFLLEISEQLLRENKKLKGTLSAKYRQGQKAGERQERERVIKLLEQDINLYGKDCWIDAIALIKGEQK
jgi:hypothetical protein